MISRLSSETSDHVQPYLSMHDCFTVDAIVSYLRLVWHLQMPDLKHDSAILLLVLCIMINVGSLTMSNKLVYWSSHFYTNIPLFIFFLMYLFMYFHSSRS